MGAFSFPEQETPVEGLRRRIREEEAAEWPDRALLRDLRAELRREYDRETRGIPRYVP